MLPYSSFSQNIVIGNKWIMLYFILDNTTDKTYIMMEARLSALFKTEDEYTVLEKLAYLSSISIVPCALCINFLFFQNLSAV